MYSRQFSIAGKLDVDIHAIVSGDELGVVVLGSHYDAELLQAGRVERVVFISGILRLYELGTILIFSHDW